MTNEVTPGAPRDDAGSAGTGGLARRTVLCGAGAAGAALLAAGCATNQNKEPKDLSGKQVAKTSDIPVGGGKTFADSKVVVTQPQQGAFKVFTAICTHQGCVVDRVSNGVIKCPCHGSEFKIADGSVAKGPASKPLKEYPAQVKNGGIVIN
ncbi:Rieske (2Fe-2S) protein [Actinomadura napierensis]|uniref:Cytochrome bc1 complex Rieske iron-sulfur subunit n=1 Tax=Actinomadura napierensis TaxID=267854 RepID=A0ABN3AC80_9ACTN